MQKNFDNVPEICSYLIENIGNVKWYIIGYGGEEQLIKDKIKEFHMEEHVILLGKKENPYPYIKECDWYIQPSRYEGKAITVREAQILHKPVIISAFPTSKSQLEDGIDGLIVPLENRECAEAITKAIQSESLKRQLIQKVSEIEYSNSFEIDKLYRIMEE